MRLRRRRRSVLGQAVLAGGLGGLEGAGEAELRRDAVHAVGRVEVLDQHELEAGRGALARGDGGVGQEELPDL